MTNRRLHSRFDPAGEADRYLAACLETRRPSCLLVVGGGEDWLSEAARKRLPGSWIVSIQLDTAFRGTERPGSDRRWYPDSGIGLRDYLAREASGKLDGGVAVVSWRPAESLFPDAASKALREIREALEELTSDAATSRYWARRWMVNALRNFLSSGTYVRLGPGTSPLVVAAAGPSLESSLEALESVRGWFRLWALASAAGACLRRGWTPDLIVSTDPGAWADRHFDALLRSREPLPCPVAFPITARIPPAVRGRHPVLLLSPGQAPEEDLPAAAGLPACSVPSRGTSSADALAFARTTTSGPVLAAGLDMAARDLRSHCRPYGLDPRILAPERRLKPGLTLVWDREVPGFPERRGDWRRGRSFDLYAGGLLPEGRPPIHRLLASPVPVAGTIPVNPEELPSLLPDPSPALPFDLEAFPAPEAPRRSSLAREALDAWESEAAEAASGRTGLPIPSRARRLLYALGGAEAAAFLAEAARGVREESLALRALKALRISAAHLRELVP